MEDNALPALDPGIYIMRNVKSDSMMDLSGGDNKSIIGFPRHGLENQQWEFGNLGEGWYIRSVHTGSYLNIESGLEDGFPVVANGFPASWVVENEPGEEKDVFRRVASQFDPHPLLGSHGRTHGKPLVSNFWSAPSVVATGAVSRARKETGRSGHIHGNKYPRNDYNYDHNDNGDYYDCGDKESLFYRPRVKQAKAQRPNIGLDNFRRKAAATAFDGRDSESRNSIWIYMDHRLIAAVTRDLMTRVVNALTQIQSDLDMFMKGCNIAAIRTLRLILQKAQPIFDRPSFDPDATLNAHYLL
ncbi:uncharacterized protein FOMMEDRAFT_148689 [Fomitiporia mediterranea MF3/22]|uniref:uncharacterized protein n=1 Tax=Fomitiporia mediterranea (strain MF3/22) TaxID=694068 RepID=UPI0004408F66|nr:uncharacterized protein FOMMEDRAFT_148689 [Fomitiporia mediterranea MF3/22]EJC99514.1 hypothetical protein FOMMEDRAFT_148689 [Fomitiporia mediterranea MF3/22]